jgi:hypothetical protein
VRVARTDSLAGLTDAMTIAFWVSPSPASNQGRLFVMSQAWEIKLNGGSPQLSVINYSRYGILDAKLASDVWQHLAFVFDHGKLSGYLDGVKRVNSTDMFTTTDPLPALDSGGLSIGAVMPVDSDPSCTCRLDDVRLYRRALDAAEITLLAR